MKVYVGFSLVLGTLSSALVADSLRIDASFMKTQNPCPANFTGMVPNPGDCHSFFICDAGIPGLIPCPAGLCFNPHGEFAACDHCSSVPGCESATGAPSTQTTSTPSSSTESQQPTSTTTQSPPNTSSDPPPSSTTTQKTTTPSGEDLSCPPDVPYIYMPYPGDCNKFYYCQNGVNTGIYKCGVGLWFHYTQQVCAFPWGSSCEN